MKYLKELTKSLLSLYNYTYPFVNVLIFFFIYDKLDTTFLVIVVGFIIYEFYNYFKHLLQKIKNHNDLMARIRNKIVFAVYGGVGAGKTTFATYCMNKYFTKENQYFNFKVVGTKHFTHKHLFLEHTLMEKPCLLIDEAGGFYDSFKYDKKYNAERKDIVNFNKFFRQFYGDGLCIYLDQSESNLNTALYRSIYFVVQLDSIVEIPSSLLMNLLLKPFVKLRKDMKINQSILKLNKKEYSPEQWKLKIKQIKSEVKCYNPFSFQEFAYMAFTTVGNYGEHYSINKDENLSKFVIPSVRAFTKGINTRAFKHLNPAKKAQDNIWGVNEALDNQVMKQNFDLIEKEVKK